MNTLLAPVLLALALQASGALLVTESPSLESRSTAAAPVCNSTAEPIINEDFYGYPNQPTYAPWTLTPTGGNPGCQYTNGYTPCLDDRASGSEDPNCL